MNPITKKAVVPIVLIFIIINGLIAMGRSYLDAWGFDRNFLMVANLVLFLITFIGLLLQQKGLRSPNPNAFVRSVYASLMVKMFICMIVFLIYAFLHKEKINKPALFTSMGLYILYTVVEVIVLMKSLQKKTNG